MVEKSNWSGIGLVFNRTNYKQVLDRSEFSRTGVYILVGNSDENALPMIYVGEGDPVKDRLNSHYSKKDFWEWAVFFVTKDNSLNKAHVQRMECRLLELARTAKQCKIENGNMPYPPTLSEADTADVDSFLVDILSILPLLGLSVFEKTESRTSLRELLYVNSKVITATGYEDAKGFVVQQNSQMVKTGTETIHAYLIALRQDLISEGVVEDVGDRYRFLQDHVFGSPSTASGVVLGRSSNGRTEWKTKNGTTLKELQIAAANAAS